MVIFLSPPLVARMSSAPVFVEPLSGCGPGAAYRPVTVLQGVASEPPTRWLIDEHDDCLRRNE